MFIAATSEVMVGRSVGNKKNSNSADASCHDALYKTFSQHGFTKTASSFLDDCKEVCRLVTPFLHILQEIVFSVLLDSVHFLHRRLRFGRFHHTDFNFSSCLCPLSNPFIVET